MPSRLQAPVDRPPASGRRRRTGTRRRPRSRRTSGPGSLGSSRIVCRHIPPAPGCQRRPGVVAAQARQLLPAPAAVGGAEQRGVLDPGVDGVRVGQRRLEMPDPLELPRVRRPVVPLVGAGGAVVGELVAHRLPGRAAVIGALDHLSRTSRSTATRRAGPGRRATPSGGRPPSPRSAGPLTSHRSRWPSEVRTNAPLRVPASTRTPLIAASFVSGQPPAASPSRASRARP